MRYNLKSGRNLYSVNRTSSKEKTLGNWKIRKKGTTIPRATNTPLTTLAKLYICLKGNASIV